MTTFEVLCRIHPIIQRQNLYDYEKAGYFTPRKIKVGNRTIRDYSEQDVRQLEQMLKYKEQGYTLRKSFELAEKDIGKERKREETMMDAELDRINKLIQSGKLEINFFNKKKLLFEEKKYLVELIKKLIKE